MLRDLGEARIDDLLLRRADWAESILLGLEDTSDLYSAWLSVTRHNWRDHVLEALEAMLDRFDVKETAMRRAASALLVLEPSHERAARCLIRHHAETQNVAAAIRVYENLRGVLGGRYGMAPSPETTALIDGLKNPERHQAVKSPGRRHRGPAPTLGIGRFATHGRKVSLAVSGFRSELIANLSKFREFTVVELTEGGAGPPEVDYVLKADCADDEDDVRMTVSVTEPVTSRVVWSDTFRLSLANWLSVQQEIVGRIASTLEVYLSHDRLARQVRPLPHDPGAYDAWLRGEDLLTRWSQAEEDEAERLFEKAIAADPDFAPAHASLASVVNARQFIRPGSVRDAKAAARSAELAQRAVALDPLDARNHLVMAWSTAMAGRYQQAEVHYELVAELNPNSPRMLVSAALGLAFMGRVDVATRLLSRAMGLTSLFLDYQWSHIAVVRYFAGDLEGAIDAADRSQNAIVDTAGWKAAALSKLGRTEEAKAALAELDRSVAAAWAGPSPAGEKDVLDWFLSVFPIRRERDRKDLSRLRLLRQGASGKPGARARSKT
jgi:TolB-like protein/DNA-binding SARP family transcriptional activator